MSTATFDAPPRSRPREADLPRPAPAPFFAPVLLGDCATPLWDQTVLSLLMQRQERGDGA